MCGPIYHIKCEGSDNFKCEKDFIGDTERNLKARFMEHRRQSYSTSEVSHHTNKNCPWHNVDMESVRILDRVPSWFERGIKQAIYITAAK